MSDTYPHSGGRVSAFLKVPSSLERWSRSLEKSGTSVEVSVTCKNICRNLIGLKSAPEEGYAMKINFTE